ncbi:MAG: hypothetical protein LUH15_14470 [Tannerellaceae bacterium]|nr:hypothetical protein [Tannerellaceae bacterium]
MDHLTVENKIELLYNEVLSLQQRAEKTNEDVNNELHRYYGKLIALIRNTSYHSYYLAFLLALLAQI